MRIERQATQKTWDIFVRIFHWSLVIALYLAFYVYEGESRRHAYAGYAVIALISFRVLWGYVGTRHARFKDFIKGPSEAKAQAKSLAAGRPRHYLGHSPLAGYMIVALLVSAFWTAWSGVELLAAEGRGPFAEGHVPGPAFSVSATNAEAAFLPFGGGGRYWEHTHRRAARFTWDLAYIHVMAAIVLSALYRENLIKSMVTGRKKERDPKDDLSIG